VSPFELLILSAVAKFVAKSFKDHAERMLAMGESPTALYVIGMFWLWLSILGPPVAVLMLAWRVFG